jgi:PAS domain S-box-containing protein
MTFPTSTDKGVLRILVVDGEEIDRLNVIRMLAQSGMSVSVDTAASGAEALAQVSHNAYACALLDYYLPGEDSPAILDSIRAIRPDLAIVVFTGRGDEEIAVEMMKAGASDYLPKSSLSPDRLAASLRHAIALAETNAARRRAVDDLQRQEAQFHTLANTIPQLAWIANLDGSRSWFNQRWYDYTGTRPDEMVGDGWLQVHHPDYRKQVMVAMRHSFETGEDLEYTSALRGADGTYRWFLTRAMPVRDADNQILSWIGTNTDITEMREQEEKLSQAVRVRDNLLATVTHDLRNPLTVIFGTIRIVRRVLASGGDLATKDLADLYESMEISAKRMAHLIDELLDAARIDAGQGLELDLEHCDLVGILRTAIEFQQTLTSDHQFPMTCNQDEIWGHWDAARLDRVFGNLLSNAAKYSPDGGVIEIDVHADEQAAVVTITDHGMGIPASEVPDIFERFRRSSNVIGQTTGFGLGLSVVRDILAEHSGAISVESIEGKGSSFTARLPLNPPRSED